MKQSERHRQIASNGIVAIELASIHRLTPHLDMAQIGTTPYDLQKPLQTMRVSFDNASTIRELEIDYE